MRKLKILAMTAALVLMPLTWQHTAVSAEDTEEDTYKQLKLFGDVFERVRADYVEEVSDKELIEAAISGMLTHLDPHSSFLDKDSFQDMQTQTRGEFGGLGIEVTMENGLVKVVAPIDDTPAFHAGIEAGDLITHLDGEPVQGLTLSEAVDKMRGPIKSEIELTVLRGDQDPFQVTIVRDTITVQSVRSRVEGDIGYLRITAFNEQTTPGLEKAIADIKEELGDTLHGLVIDLRNNPGGLLDEAISVSDAYLERGEIVSTRGRHEDSAQRWNASEGDLAEDLPIVVLINGGSASASEIVAGALQDHRRAIVLGTQSFGKGSVQTIVPLGGQGAMRLTTARYYTPSGRSIQAKGIEPDIFVPQARVEELQQGQRRSEADLRGALGNPDDESPAEEEAQEEPDASEESESPDAESSGDGEEPEEEQSAEEAEERRATDDYQLARAIDLLRGIALYNQRTLN